MKEREEIIKEYLLGYNNYDIPKMTEHLSKDIHFQNIQNDEVNMELKGLEAFINQAESAKTFFTSREQRPIDFQHFPDRTELSIEYTGILAVDFPNGLKKGEKIHLNGKSVFHFENGLITKIIDIS
jgi:hypothetical protein